MNINKKGRAKSIVGKPLFLLGTVKLAIPTFTAGGLIYTYNMLGAKGNGGTVSVVENALVTGTVVSGNEKAIVVEIEDLSATDNDALKLAIETAFPAVSVNVQAIGASAPTAHSGVFAGGVGAIEGVDKVVRTAAGKYTVTVKKARKVLACNFDVLAAATDSAIAKVAVENVATLLAPFTAINVSTRNYSGAAADATANDYLSVNVVVQE